MAINGEIVIPGMSPELVREAEEINKAKQREDAKVLDALLDDDFTLFSWGETEPLKITRGGKAEYLRFRIKSVAISDIMDSYQSSMPSPPAILKTYKKDSDVARQLGQKHDVVVWEVNEADSAYREMKQKHDTDASQEILLRGLAHDFNYKGKLVLKGANVKEPTQILDKEGALAYLQRIGLSSDHFAAIVKNIRNLTNEAETQETLE